MHAKVYLYSFFFTFLLLAEAYCCCQILSYSEIHPNFYKTSILAHTTHSPRSCQALNTTHPTNAAPPSSFPPSLRSYVLVAWGSARKEWGQGIWGGTRRKAAVARQARMEEEDVNEGGGTDGGGAEEEAALGGGGIEGEDDSDRV